jgi:hypothetical protein|tara:strand:+ start:479 stop:1015 length:537 start_codon:yes stop_codon:yes gene_type:complete
MKKLFFLLLLPVVGLVGLATTFYFTDYHPEEYTVSVVEKFIPLSFLEQEELERKKQKEIILAGLLSRCENFGWSDEDSVAACIQQEAYRDLQIEKQKYEIKLLEKKLVTAQTQTQTQTQVVDDEPLFFMFLNAYAKAKEKESLNQMKRDISSLKSQARYLKNKDNTKFALDVLYRDNN